MCTIPALISLAIRYPVVSEAVQTADARPSIYQVYQISKKNSSPQVSREQDEEGND